MNQEDIPGFHRYIRLEQLVSNYGNKYAQNLLKKEFETLKGTRWVDGSDEVKLYLKQHCSRNKDLQMGNQKVVVDSGDLAQFDLTLTSKVINSISSFKPILLEHLKNLVDVRNAFKHFADLNLSNQRFESYWEPSAKALVEFGMPPGEIEDIKTSIYLNSHVLTETEPSPKNTRKARQILKKGKRRVKRQAYEEAIQLYSKGLALAGLGNKHRTFLFSNRSQARIISLKNKNHPDDEIAVDIVSANNDAQSLISIDPMWWVGYHLVGQVHHYKKEYQEAINWFCCALQLNPDAKEAKLFRDVCRLEQSQVNSQDYCSPLGIPSSLEEQAEKFRKRRGFGPSGKILIEAINNGLLSQDPRRKRNANLIKAKLQKQGVDLALDHKAAFKMYRELSEQGHIDAYAELATCYLFPEERGVDPDVEKGVHWIEKSANAAVTHGIFLFGRLYEDGVGKPQDHCKALELYLEASKKGHGGASLNLSVFYANGTGCRKDEELARQFLILAAIREIPSAMDQLAWDYLQVGDVNLALSWYEQALKYENMHSLLRKKKFNEAAAATHLTRIAQILEQYGIYVGNKSVSQVLTEIKNMQKNETTTPVNPQVATRLLIDESDFYRGTVWEHRMEIQERARQGFPYAKELLNTMNLFRLACLTMMTNPMHAIRFFADCLRKSDFVADYTETIQEKVEVLCNTIFRGNMGPPNSLDLCMRICKVGLQCSRNYCTELFPYLEECIAYYPDEKFFPEALACLLAHSRRFEKSFEVFVSTLERFPANPDLLAGKMQVMIHLIRTKVSVDDVAETCKQFIDLAPHDHRMVPEAYFTLAFLEITEKDNKVEGKNIYTDGLKAEKCLISYFLPYKSHIKETVKRYLKAENILGGVENSMHSGSNRNEERIRFSRATGPVRFEITMEHRKGHKQFHDMIIYPALGQFGYFSRFSFPPMHQPTRRDVKYLKEITIQEMYPHGDKIHEGRILHVQIVEKSWNIQDKWYSVVKDKFHDCIHITIDGLPDALTKLWIGTKLSIKNPYYRLAFEKEKRAIRVDDLSSLTFGESVRFCHYCWKEDADGAFCEFCMADYCDEECQRKDMRLLNHQYICPDSEDYFDSSDGEFAETEDDSEFSESD